MNEINSAINKSRINWVPLLALICAASVLLVLLCFLITTRRGRLESSVKLVQLQNRQQELEQYSKSMEQYIAAHNECKEMACTAISRARSVKDVPDLGLERIVWSGNKFVVPKGKHKLIISGYWRALSDSDRKIIPHPEGYPYSPGPAWRIKGTDGFKRPSQQWKIPLEPESAYRFSFENNKKIAWTLTSNNSDFRTRSVTLPFRVVKRKLSESFTNQYLLLPAEVDCETMITEPLSNKRQLLQGYHNFVAHNKKDMGLIIKVEISSEGEPCLSRRTALRMMAGEMGGFVTLEEQPKRYLLNLESVKKAKESGDEIRLPPNYIDTFH